MRRRLPRIHDPGLLGWKRRRSAPPAAQAAITPLVAVVPVPPVCAKSVPARAKRERRANVALEILYDTSLLCNITVYRYIVHHAADLGASR